MTLTNTSIPNQHRVQFYTFEKTIMMTVVVTVALVGVVGNLLTCVIFGQNKSLRTSINYLIVSLAVADVLQSLNMVFLLTSIMGDGWILSYYMCQLCGWTNMSFIITSVISLALIALNRFFRVVKKSDKKMFNKKNTLRLIAVSWIYPAVFSLAPIFGWAKYEYRPGKLICTLQFSESISYTLALMGTAIFGPYVVMCYCTYKIVKEIRLSRKRIESTTQIAQTRRKAETRVSIMLISIVLFFFMFYSPASIVNLIQLAQGNDYTTPYRIDAWSVIMAMFNHANNPIIYCVLNTNFRKGFKGLCSKSRRLNLNSQVEMDGRQNQEKREERKKAIPERKF